MVGKFNDKLAVHLPCRQETATSKFDNNMGILVRLAAYLASKAVGLLKKEQNTFGKSRLRTQSTKH